MAVNITATRSSTLFNDQDGDGQFDPGDIVTTRIRITVGPGDNAEGVTVNATTNGLTVDSNDSNAVQVTPIAFDDFLPSITGNTPMTFTASQLLGNDVDPDGAEINLVISGVNSASNGAIVNNGDGTFTFTPTTGYVGTASFQYTVTDEDGLASVSTGIVTFSVTDPVWYVNAATGSDITGDGSWAKPFATLAPLSTGGSADGLDNADDTIFVYNAGTYGSGIVLETGQKLFGDGHAFVVNGLSIGANASNTTINYSGVGVTLASNNTIMGVTLNGAGAGAVGLQDNGNVGTLVVDATSITGQGKAVDIDSGGTLNVDLDQLSSMNSTTEGVHLQGVTGTFSAATGTIETAVGVSVLIGAAGGATASSGGDVNFTYGGAISLPIGNAVEIQDRTGGTVTFSGAIGDNAINAGTTGILIDGSAGTVNFNGQVNLNAGAGGGNGIALTNNSGTINFAAGGTGLDIATTTGTGLTFTGGGTLNITGANNSVTTTTGQVLNLQNGAMGTGGIAFGALTSGTVAAGNAININNLDAAGAGIFSGGAVTIGGTAGAGADAINITASNSTFNFASATIGSTAVGNFVTGDGIEINGTLPNTTGAVTFGSVNINGVSGAGINIIGATNAVNVNGGNIGGTNDAGGDGVFINGGTGAVVIAASISKSSGGNQAVDISGHSVGTIDISGALTASGTAAGVRVANNTGGTINFTGATSLTTAAVNAIDMTGNTGGTTANFTNSSINLTTTSGTAVNFTGNSGGNISFTPGSAAGSNGLVISTTTGIGINASGGGNLNIDDTATARNTVTATTGRAIVIDGTVSNIDLKSVAASGGGSTPVFLKDTGATGHFVVTGTGTSANSGGTISNISGADAGSSSAASTTGTGIYLENVSNVSLSNMLINGTFSNFGIRGEKVTNFTLRNSDLTGTYGTSATFDEGAIRFGTENLTSQSGIKGTALFEGNTIGGGYENNLSVFVYSNDTLNMTVQDSAARQAVFNVNQTTQGDDSLHVESGGTSNLTLNVTGVAFNGARGDQLQTLAIGNTTQNITITNNQMLNGHTNIVSGGGGVTLLGGDTAATSNVNITYNFSGNTIRGAVGDALQATYTGTAGIISGTIANNIIGTAGGGLQGGQAAGSSGGGAGIVAGLVRSAGTGSLTYAVKIQNNTVHDVADAFGGIILRSNMQGTTGTARLEATVTGNTVAEMGGNVLSGLYAIVGGQSSAANSQDAAKMGLSISGNTLNAGPVNGGSAIFLDQLSGAAQYYVPGYTVNANTSHGEFRPSGGGGTASTSLSNFWNPTNTLNNGPFPTIAGSKVDANQVTNVGNQAFVLGIPAGPMMAGSGLGWEDQAPPVNPTFDDGAAGREEPADASGGTGDSSGTPPAGDGGTGGNPGTGGTGGSGTPPVAGDDGMLSQAELDVLIEAAIQRWIDAGATAAQVDAMRAVQFGIVDMAGIFVGSSTHGIVNIDNDAAGHGWFVDSTPGEDSEYEGSGTRLTADSGGAAQGKIDLLTVVMHELGHQIGLGDEYAGSSSSELMYGYVNAGERRLPAAGEAAGATPGSVGSTAYAITPVVIGTIPTGKTVDVFIKATINDQRDNFIVNLVNTATISGSNFANQVAQETLALDSLTLGNLVFLDVNKDGDYDAGTDTGIVGVVVDLYADTNDSGGWDAGDVFLGTTTTAAGGLYSFAGLAHGDYIVVVKSTNFGSGGVLEGLSVAPGTAADPDDNAENDNNGAAATGGAVASKAINLEYNQEPTAGTGNDVNNTVDFGFAQNAPPVAVDDPGLTATEDTPAQYSTELTGNDTDPDGDARTIVSAGNATNGTVSVTAGVVTFTPTANFNGTATFEYTIDDGNGNQDTAVATVTVGAVNDPITTTAPADIALNEDSVDFAVTGLSIGDADAALAPAGVYEVTLSATQGTLKLTTTTGLTFSAGDGDGDVSMSFSGTLADINAALATAKYTPNANYAGPAQIGLTATDSFGGVVATGSGDATADGSVISVTVDQVNDEPAGTDDGANAVATVPYVFLAMDFSDGFSDSIDGDSFAGVKITTLPAVGTLKLNGVAIAAGDTITLAQLDNGELTYDSPAAAANTQQTFTFQVQDDGGTANGGVDLDQSPNTFTLDVAPSDIAPVLDLDSDGAGTGFASAYSEGGAAAAISDTDVLITDADAGDQVEGATITITNAVAGDVLTVVGTLPGSIIVDAGSTATTLILTGTGTQAEYAQAIEQITFANTGDDPTAGGTNASRTINVTVTDGDLPSNVAVTTISVADDNADAPSGTSSTIIADEDSFRLLQASDLGFTDSDGTFASVTISAVSGGGIYFDADGSAGAGAPALATLPATYTAQDLVDGKVSFRADSNANGAGIGSITFAVTDDDGNVDASPNVLTVDVTAVNDSPVLTTGGPIAATEQIAVAILPSGSVADIDLDARNGGAGDYAGSSLAVHRNPAINPTEDVFALVAGPNFTIDGSSLKTAGGQIFANFSIVAGTIVVNFTSQEAIATSALVDEVIQAVRYTNISDNPPASVDLKIGFGDGAPGGGQGIVVSGNDLDSNVVTVNIAAVNDAPVNSLGGTIGTTEDAVDAWLSGMSISDPDADPATDEMYITFQVVSGSIEIRTDVAGGIGAGDIIAQAVDTITVLATLNEINATLAANNGLTYSPNPNFNGTDTLSVYTNDQGANGSDPGLTGDGTSEEGFATRTIDVQAQPDAPIARPDAVSTAENAIGTGDLFANNGSGADSDADAGDQLVISEVNGSSAAVGQEIILASGAKLTVNADGTYSYNPNGKFNRLTDNSSGAVNTSATDTFSYTLAGGNTVTVTMTVNGVAGPGDWLMGDSGDNVITGTPQGDVFVVSQGGDDTVSGLGADDAFYFGGALTAADNVDGGAGSDTIVLQGDYSGGLTLDGSVVNIERISMLAGTNTAFGDPGTNLYDYDLTTHDSNFAAGLQVVINGSSLLAGEDFRFDGSAETDAKFVILGGRGTDDLTGGAGNDIFFFHINGHFGEGDTVDGGAGYDGLFLRGNYTIDFTQPGYAGALTGLENLTVSGASDERYARGGGTEFDYSITWDDDLLAAGQSITINGSTLQSEESLSFNGSDESNGRFSIFGGAGNDVLTGGAGADLISGGLRGDTLTGGAGNDIFRYSSTGDSNSTERDGIQDFNSGDVIDLSRIDANETVDGNQAFAFVGSAAFSGTAGELRFENISLGGPIWLVQGDTNGDGVSDFEVVLVISPPDPITSSDF
ncbi:MAG TPA: tandem-95 repeat protein, partial [Allosphingosinicella sp.]|nr:tandem-95 repeat protein [Allosphingosinicella sp.]